MVYIENNLIDSDGGIFLTVDSLIETNSIITVSNVTLRKANVNPYGFDKRYMDKELIEDQFYQKIDQSSETKITSTKFF